MYNNDNSLAQKFKQKRGFSFVWKIINLLRFSLQTLHKIIQRKNTKDNMDSPCIKNKTYTHTKKGRLLYFFLSFFPLYSHGYNLFYTVHLGLASIANLSHHFPSADHFLSANLLQCPPPGFFFLTLYICLPND